MAKKSTNTEETKQSTVVLNDEVNPIQDPVEDTPTPVDTGDTEDTEDTGDTGNNCPPTGDCTDPNHVCTCKPGHCPNENCKSGHYWTEGGTTVEYLYHYDTEDETTPSKTMKNPDYVAPKPPKDPEPSKPGTENPGGNTQNPPQTPDAPSNDCGDEMDEPWAHDELLQPLDGRTSLERELRWHCGVTYDVVEMWLNELKTAADKDAVIAKIAWHIPTGGPKSIKVHHKAKIVEALKTLK